MSHVRLIVGPLDMPVPDRDIRPDYVDVYKTVSPGVYINISE